MKTGLTWVKVTLEVGCPSGFTEKDLENTLKDRCEDLGLPCKAVRTEKVAKK